MKNLLIAAAMMLPFCIQAQYSISGAVKSKNNNEPLVGTVIFIDGSFISVQSGADGNYSIKNLKSGTYVLKTRMIGYEQFSDTVQLSDNKVIDIELKENPLMMDEVVVKATRADEKSAVAYTNVSKEEIAAQNLGQDLPYLLNQTPSAVVTSDAGGGVGYTGLRIRGSDATRVNVTIDGIPVNDAEDQGVYWVDLPDIASSVDNIQVQRGVGTSTNGAGAFGGSLNIQTTALNPKPYGEVSSSFGSFNTFKNTVNFGSGLIDGKWAIDGRMSKITSDGYIDRASSDLKSYYLSGGYYGKKTIVKLIIFSGVEKTYQAWYGVPEDSLKAGNRTFNPAGMYVDANGKIKYYNNETDNYQQDYYQLHFSHEFNSRWNVSAALHFTKGEGYYEEYVPNDSLKSYGLNNVNVGNTTISTSDIIRRQWLSNNFYGTTFSLNYKNNKKLTTTLGGAWNEYDGEHYGDIIWAQYASNSSIDQKYYDNNAVKKDFNIFAKANYQLAEKLNVYGDMQYRTINYSFLGYDDNLNNVQQQVNLNFFNPKAGLTYQLNSNGQAYVSYAVGNKEPSRDDYTQSTPNSRPKPETLNDIEVGYRQNIRIASWGINFYNMNYKNQLVLTGQLNDVGAYNRTNVDESYRRGIELEGNVNLSKKWKLGANATFSQNKIENFKEYIDDYDNGGQIVNNYKKTNIAFSPNVIGAGQLSYEPIKGLVFSAISKYVGQQYLDNTSNSDRMLNSYFVQDVRIRYTFKTKFIREIGLNFYVNNILNAKYESNGSTYNYFQGGKVLVFNSYYPQAGTNFLAGLTLKF